MPLARQGAVTIDRSCVNGNAGVGELCAETVLKSEEREKLLVSETD